jgi:hypothetical protein
MFHIRAAAREVNDAARSGSAPAQPLGNAATTDLEIGRSAPG